MEDLHLAYLGLLDELGACLEKLTELAREKTTAVRKDDLAALDQILKREQAQALSLRGLEQKRLKLLSQLGLEGVPLSGLAARYPGGLQLQAKQAGETLLRRYQIYQSAAEVARNTLECNLHEVEKYLSELGVDPTEGPGYAPPGADRPKPMKTDFRA